MGNRNCSLPDPSPGWGVSQHLPSVCFALCVYSAVAGGKGGRDPVYASPAALLPCALWHLFALCVYFAVVGTKGARDSACASPVALLP